MDPQRKRDASPRPSEAAYLEERSEPAARVRVEPSPLPQVTRAAGPGGRRLPALDALAIVALVVGLGWAAIGLIVFAFGLAFGLDMQTEWPVAVAIILVALCAGLLPGLASAFVGARRIRTHAQLRRLVAVVRGNDSVDIATLARLLETSEKRARRLAVDALSRGALDARYDAKADRLVLKPSASPFR